MDTKFQEMLEAALADIDFAGKVDFKKAPLSKDRVTMALLFSIAKSAAVIASAVMEPEKMLIKLDEDGAVDSIRSLKDVGMEQLLRLGETGEHTSEEEDEPRTGPIRDYRYAGPIELRTAAIAEIAYLGRGRFRVEDGVGIMTVDTMLYRKDPQAEESEEGIVEDWVARTTPKPTEDQQVELSVIAGAIEEMRSIFDEAAHETLAPVFDWDEAAEHLIEVIRLYQKRGRSGKLALSATLEPLHVRYVNGERTPKLHREMMAAT